MQLVLLGFPGAGKGTQGELLSQELEVPHISTGGIFRYEIESETELGKQALAYMNRGELVPDEITIEMVKVRLSALDCKQGFILDGFPRSVAQARALDRALPELGVGLDAAVHIEISQDEAVRRICDRLVCQQCEATYSRQSEDVVRTATCRTCGGALIQRSDDTQETVENRLRVYLEQTRPVIAYYQSCGSLTTVNGEQSVTEVFHEIVQSLRADSAGAGSTGVGQ